MASKVMSDEDIELFDKLITNADLEPLAEYNAYNQYESCPRIWPYLEIVEQPNPLYNFRYISEFKKKPHGPLTGENSLKTKRTYPTVKLNNYKEKAIIRCWLCVNNCRDVHCHQLLSKNDTGRDVRPEPYDIIVSLENNYTAVFEGLNIIHSVTKREDHLKSFHKRKEHIQSGFYSHLENYPYDEQSLIQEIKTIEKDVAVLYFEAFDFDTKIKLGHIFSNEIKNSKNVKNKNLKVVRQSHERGLAIGASEVLIFVEKIAKEDLKILFYEYDGSGQICWEEEATILEFWHQVAIAFSTPPYCNQNIIEDKKVFFKLVRKADGCESNEMEYFYQPDYRNQLNYSEAVIGKKRRLDFQVGDPTFNNTDKGPLSLRSSEEHQLETLSTDFLDNFFNMTNLEEQIEISPYLDFDNVTTVEDKCNLVVDSCSTESLEEDIACSTSVQNSNLQTANLIHAEPSPDKKPIESSKGDIITLINSLFIHVSQQCNPKVVPSILKKLRQNKINLKNLGNIYKKTPMHIAIENGRSEFVQLLISAGFDVNAVDIDRNSALHLAVIYNADNITVKFLLEAGAQVSVKNFAGETPVHLACRLGRHMQLQIFLAFTTFQIIQGICKKTGDSFLHIAVKYGYYEVAEILMNEGLQAYALNLADCTPLGYAVEKNDYKMVKLLLSLMDVKDSKNFFLVDDISTKVYSDHMFQLLQDYLNNFDEKKNNFTNTTNYEKDLENNVNRINELDLEDVDSNPAFNLKLKK